jgi:uncharacterized membrane protein (DUF106 family)
MAELIPPELMGTIAIPLSTLLVTSTAVGMNIISNVATRKLTDITKFRRVRAETQAFRKEMTGAVKSKNQTKIAKLKKKEQKMRQLEAKSSMERMRPMLFFWIPFIAIYYLLTNFLGGINTIVAIPPMVIQIPGLVNIGDIGLDPIFGLSVFWWYFISSFAFSGVISKLLGTSMDM